MRRARLQRKGLATRTPEPAAGGVAGRAVLGDELGGTPCGYTRDRLPGDGGGVGELPIDWQGTPGSGRPGGVGLGGMIGAVVGRGAREYGCAGGWRGPGAGVPAARGPAARGGGWGVGGA